MRFERASGVLLHPTSLPGPHGSGDLGPDARHFVDWLVAGGQKLWQVLPLAGIGPGNSPYMSNSAFAGNLLLIDLAELQQQGWLEPDDLQPVPGMDAHAVEFGIVHRFRMERLAKAARAFAARGTAEQRAGFAAFEADHASWLADYALFISLCEERGWSDWWRWEPGLVRRDPAVLADARARHAERVFFFRFGQWCFHRQWAKLKAYANGRGVQIIGDTPIFIAYLSAEVWANQHLFELDDEGRPTVVAGVPPDYFSATGQLWGNPLYRWSAHAEEHYAWWIARMRSALRHADVVRIDHFRGFAGYWEVPATAATAIGGQWRPGPGIALFDAMRAALGELPIIAEDLGTITDDVIALRDDLGLPGMAVLQFAFGGGPDNAYLPHNLQRNCVIYTGTHDNDTSRGWFATAPDAERRATQVYLKTDGSEIQWDLIHAASSSVAALAIYPMQDVLGLDSDARMNVPGRGDVQWRWRFTWDQVAPWQAERLALIGKAHGRRER